MPPVDWSKVLSAAVVPVVIISACGLLCLAFYNRLAAIVSRLRGFQRERLHEQEVYARALFTGEIDRVMLARHHRVLDALEVQTARVTRRAKLIRRTLLCLLGTIALLTLCSIASGLSLRWPQAAYGAVALFALGMCLLLAGVVTAMIEMRDALEPVEIENEFVSRLTHELDRIAGTHDPGA